jgi:hypothetical protein
MKIATKLFSLSLLCLLLVFTSCDRNRRKNKLDEKTIQFNKDVNTLKSESDQIDSDINSALNDIPSIGGRIDGIASSPLCGCTIDSSQIADKIIYFNFDGITPCFSPSRTRAGKIKVQLTTGNKWSEAGSVLTITYINYKVTRLSDNKSVMLNGTKTLQNVNGNNWLGFLLGNSEFLYRERAFNLQVTFDDNSQATWNTAKLTTWKYTPSETKITFSAKGDTTLNGLSNVDSWGVNRFNYNFTINFNSPWVSNTYCGLWRPVSGEVVYKIVDNDFMLTLGVNQNGEPSTLACAYGYKVTWTNSSGNIVSAVFSY